MRWSMVSQAQLTWGLHALTVGSVLLTGCGGSASTYQSESKILRLAVTTSTRDSGLLDVLVPVFEREHDAQVDMIAVGTGKALKLGEGHEQQRDVGHHRPKRLWQNDAAARTRRSGA